MERKFAPYSPDFERLRQTLYGHKSDRIPLFELAVDVDIMSKFLSRPVTTLADKIEFSRLAGYDYVKLSPSIRMNPVKDASVPWGTEGKGAITTLQEYEQFHFAEVEDQQFADFERVSNMLPDGMKVVGQYGDIFTFAWEFMGFETFSFALIENPDLVKKVVERVGEIVLELFRRMSEFDSVGALFYSDDIAYQSGLMLSPKTLRDLLFPWMARIGDLCKARNIPYIYHSDGKLWQVMDDLAALGIDALQPLEPQAWDIEAVKEKYGEQFCLIGNVDVDLLARGTLEEIRETVTTLINKVGQQGGYCVGSGNTVPKYAKAENFRAMVETTWRLGAF
ncbi:nucleoside 2-deoxyribosyltransferase [candidate division KSB1 bacterium]|nr:nucleoside 2-deoxyribosyltransferase [candidate division KSB1 bacterium]